MRQLVEDFEAYLGDPHSSDVPFSYEQSARLDAAEQFPAQLVQLLNEWGLHRHEVTADAVTGGYRISGEKWMINNATEGLLRRRARARDRPARRTGHRSADRAERLAADQNAELGAGGHALGLAMSLACNRLLSGTVRVRAPRRAFVLAEQFALDVAATSAIGVWLANRPANDDSVLWGNGIWLHAVLARPLSEPSTVDVDDAVITALTRQYAEGRSFSLTAHRIAEGMCT